MSSADLRTVYAAYLEAANAREFHRMAEFAHDTIVFNGDTVSRDAYVAAMRQAVGSVQNYTWRLDDLIIEGERVAARLTVTGTPVKQWLGLQPTGRHVTFTEYAFYHFREGRFDRMWYLLDTRAIEEQLAARDDGRALPESS
ncbi:ester cyclase [Couchioplanes caeruleus]|uniref:ester cyclase n=1 Tax=Couchioplanes caeruleus TaxID=56438 RepID=UPI0020BE9BCA|nr:ester cyclase [Couchioplanes caeruleus]UQU62686.1 ester cyclase [Couchioplanes caeruleus]